jgi:hypothetical protein
MLFTVPRALPPRDYLPDPLGWMYVPHALLDCFPKVHRCCFKLWLIHSALCQIPRLSVAPRFPPKYKSWEEYLFVNGVHVD